MKKFAAWLLTAGLLVSLAGCSLGEKPDKVVTEFCEGMKAFDLEAMAACTTDGDSEVDSALTMDDSDPASAVLLSYFQDQAANLTYTVEEAAVDGDEATVPVTFTYTDGTDLLGEALGEFISQAVVQAIGGADEEEIAALFPDIFNEKAAAAEPATATVQVRFTCRKADGSWKIDDLADADSQTALMNVITCNMYSAIEDAEAQMGDLSGTAQAG